MILSLWMYVAIWDVHTSIQQSWPPRRPPKLFAENRTAQYNISFTYISHILYSIQYLDTDISFISLFFSKKGICIRTDPIPTSTAITDRIPRRAPFTEAEWSERQEYRCRNVKRWPPVTTWCPRKKKILPKQQHVAGGSLSMDWINSHGI